MRTNLQRSWMGAMDEKVMLYLGSQGCHTNRITSQAMLIDLAVKAYGLKPAKSVGEVHAVLTAMTPKERSTRIRNCVPRLWPRPNDLWPAHAPARRGYPKGQTGERVSLKAWQHADISEVIREMPAVDEKWPADERAEWLRRFSEALDRVFEKSAAKPSCAVHDDFDQLEREAQGFGSVH